MPGQLRPYRSGAVQLCGSRPGAKHWSITRCLAGEFLPVPHRISRIHPSCPVDIYRLAGLQQGRQAGRKIWRDRVAGPSNRSVVVYPVGYRPHPHSCCTSRRIHAGGWGRCDWAADFHPNAGMVRVAGFNVVPVGDAAGWSDPFRRDFMVSGGGRGRQIHPCGLGMAGRLRCRHARLVCRT